ncbi:hypothetical protein Atai01_39760 [Amycolatopsis taiwanensis]|uniref:Uncharacterized protein n=1 Tax=Amycolatopsis taiwanensis TaxID=342230 RepID=A0A9W6VHD9_9PSEU|nr:hypothetical protein Atai01_39760 [Amycolatopsis taiwanensis]
MTVSEASSERAVDADGMPGGVAAAGATKVTVSVAAIPRTVNVLRGVRSLSIVAAFVEVVGDFPTLTTNVAHANTFG